VTGRRLHLSAQEIRLQGRTAATIGHMYHVDAAITLNSSPAM